MINKLNKDDIFKILIIMKTSEWFKTKLPQLRINQSIFFFMKLNPRSFGCFKEAEL